MTGCTVTTGFFVLGRCGKVVVTVCAACSRPLCAGHVNVGNRCPECAAGNDYGAVESSGQAWLFRWRRHYYQRGSQQYQDPHWYASFDSYDRAPFRPGANRDGGDFDDGDERDYLDS
jgi:uncharacterized OB-fold protein